MLAGPTPSGSADAPRICQGSQLLPPSPAPPGAGCPQLRQPAATDWRRRSLTSARNKAPRGAAVQVDKLTGAQQASLAHIKKTNGPLYRAYLIKERLRQAFAARGEHGRALLAGVISWASRSRIPEMVMLAATLKTYQKTIKNTLDSGVTNGRVEATNTHIQTLIKQAYGYGSADALIAMIELKHGGLCPELPGR